MDIDLGRLTQVLQASTDQMKKAPEKAGEIFETVNTELGSITVEDVESSEENQQQLNAMKEAIAAFLQSTKDAQETGGKILATLNQNPAFAECTGKLKNLSEFLKRGERVEKTEQEGL
jgi:hypothetical protein